MWLRVSVGTTSHPHGPPWRRKRVPHHFSRCRRRFRVGTTSFEPGFKAIGLYRGGAARKRHPAVAPHKRELTHANTSEEFVLSSHQKVTQSPKTRLSPIRTAIGRAARATANAVDHARRGGRSPGPFGRTLRLSDRQHLPAIPRPGSGYRGPAVLGGRNAKRHDPRATGGRLHRIGRVILPITAAKGAGG